MSDRKVASAATVGALIAAGLVLMGYLLAGALYAVRASDRYVTVKGFAERVVPANLALWPVVFTVTADDLATLQSRAEESARLVEKFLSKDFSPRDFTLSAPRITDRQAQGYNPQGARLDRYLAEATVTLRTENIDAAKQAMSRSGEMVKQGVALIRSYEYNTQYLFTGLEGIKPEMIAEATRDARRAAEQFAEDSGSRVGAIRNAQQGLFSIRDRDTFSPEFKKVRVVTTVQYFLVDD